MMPINLYLMSGLAMPSSNSSVAVRVVIPARYASTRLPAKPLIDLAGLPMVVRVYRRVVAALVNTNIVVATDDARIAEILDKYAIPCVMTEASHVSGTDRVAEVARYLNWGEGDIVINVQGDEPLIPLDMLRAFADFCVAQSPFAMGTVAVPMTNQAQVHDANVVKVMLNKMSEALLFSRSAIPFCRDNPPAEWPLSSFLRHIGIYAYRNSVLQELTRAPVCESEKLEKLEQLRALWLGYAIKIMTWHKSPPHGVDTLEDAERVSMIIAKLEKE